MFLVAVYKVHNEELFLPASIKTIYPYVDAIFVNISTIPWGWVEERNGPLQVDMMDRTFSRLIDLRLQGLKKIGISIGEYDNEYDHITDTLKKVRRMYPQITHYLYIDADEGWTPQGIQAVVSKIKNGWDRVGSLWTAKWCFWKNYHYRIVPPETTPTLVAFRVTENTRFSRPPNCRSISETPKVEIAPGEAMFYHFSWVREDEEQVRRKVKGSSHRGQFIPNWYENVWLKWNRYKNLKKLHPTHAWCYQEAKKMPLVDIPKPFLEIEKFCNEEHLCDGT